MSLLGQFTRAYVINRMARGSRHRPRGYGYGYGRHPRAYGRRSRGGFDFWGPFPRYSRRTRGGSRVSVSGCCLPIPLGVIATLGAGARLLVRR